MKRHRRRWLPDVSPVPDDLTLLGVIALAAWITLSAFWMLRGRPGQLLWLSDIAMFCAALGFLFRSPLILTAQFVGVFAFHLVWLLDLIAFLVIGQMPIGIATYMVEGSLSTIEMSLSLFQHAFLIPATGWALFRLGASRKGWLLQSVQSITVFTLTYLLTNPAHNVNWVFGTTHSNLSPVALTPLAYYAVLLFGPPFLLYLPCNAVANWFARQGQVAGLGIHSRVFHLGIAGGASVVLVLAALAIAGSLRLRTTPVPSLLRLSLPELEAIPIDSNLIELASVEFGDAGAKRALPLRAFAGSLGRAVKYSRPSRPVYLKSLLDQVPIDSIPGAPLWLLVRGRRHTGIVTAAVVVSDRLYPQQAVDANIANHFTLQIQLGRPGIEEFGLESQRSRAATAKDPFVVGSGVGALYAVTVVGLQGNRPVVRTPLFLFKRTSVHEPVDLRVVAPSRIP